MSKKAYTAPAVVSCTDAVQNTKGTLDFANDGDPSGDPVTPGSLGYYL